LIEDVLKGVELRDLLKPEAIQDVTARLQHTAEGYKARTAEELALFLQELGDLSAEEISTHVTLPEKAGEWVDQLAGQGRIVELNIPAGQGSAARWVPLNRVAECKAPGQMVLLRMLRTNGPLTHDAMLARYAFKPDWLDETLLHLVTAREVVKGRFTLGGVSDEYIDKQNLEQIHRRTITLLRKEIQPVSLYAYSAFMARWQHVHPMDHLSGQDGLRQVLDQLRGLALPGQVWERDCFPARMVDYHSSDLNSLFQQGECVWVGNGKDPRRVRMRFILRGEGRLFLEEPTPHDALRESMGSAAQAVYDYLKQEGASFYNDIQSGLRLNAEVLQTALVDLVMAGMATNDTVEALHAVFSVRTEDLAPEPDHPRPTRSALEDDLAQRLNRPGHAKLSTGHTARPSREKMRMAQQRVNERMRGAEPMQHTQRVTLATGRWSLVHRAAVLGPALSADERAERVAHALLNRYGIVTRECLAGEDGTTDWSALYQVLQRMEMRGEVRRGLFVDGFPGVQFALPEAVEKLRSLSGITDEVLIVLSAADPVNLFGTEMPHGPIASDGQPLIYARVPSTHCVFWQGKPILVAEDNGERMTTLESCESDLVQRAVRAYLNRPGATHRVLISTWNGRPALGSAAQALLQPLGFSRTPAGLERWQD
jgi:ATP-dependent Lhr-like helicase